MSSLVERLRHPARHSFGEDRREAANEIERLLGLLTEARLYVEDCFSIADQQLLSRIDEALSLHKADNSDKL